MNQVRSIVAAAGVGCLLLLGIPSSGAATNGVGSSGGGTEVLHLEIGDGALDVRLLNELSATSNDAGVATPEALERLTPLTIASSLVPALSNLSLPPVESRSQGAENAVSAPTVDLGSLGGPVPGLLDGTLSATLRSLVDAEGALATLAGGADGVSVLGGVLNLGNLDASLGSLAAPLHSGGNRSLTLDQVEVLDLSALLQLLGIDVTDLPLDVVTNLLDSLGVALPGNLTPSALVGQVNTLVDSIQAQVGTQLDTLQAQLADAEGDVDAALAAIPGLQSALQQAQAAVAPLQQQLTTLQGQLGGLICPNILVQVVCDQIATVTTQLNTATAAVTSAQNALAAGNALVTQLRGIVDGLIDQIQALLAQVAGIVDDIVDLVQPLLDNLLNLTLLTIEDLNVGTVADARDTVGNSVATVTGSIGAITIGGVTVPGLDALATVDQVTAVADQITGVLGDVLGTIDPSLANLVDIDVLDRSTSITANGATTEAVAAITGLRVTITPPDLCGLLTRLGATPIADRVGPLLQFLGEQLPPLPVVGDVLGDLGSVLNCNPQALLVGGLANALTQPLTLEALTVGSQGAFTPAGQVTPTTSTSTSTTTTQPGSPTTAPRGSGPLPRTGGDVVLAAAGVGLLVTALGMRRIASRAVR
jgi:hypothetical protein